MTQPAQPTTAPPRRRPPPRRIHVKRVERLTPLTVRVTFTGDELATYAWNGPAAHIKLAFPDAGQSEPIFPVPDGPRPTMRTFTPRRFDAAALELDVEFVLHGEGPASTWASQARSGQKLLV